MNFTIFPSAFVKNQHGLSAHLTDHSDAVVLIVVRLLKEHEVNEEDCSQEHSLNILIFYLDEYKYFLRVVFTFALTSRS